MVRCPGVAQHVLSGIAATSQGGESWAQERIDLLTLLIQREPRSSIVQRTGVAVNPSHDGFFAWYECEDPEHVVEACAQQHVYLVPLKGGVRIGLCAIPHHQIERVATALHKATEMVQ